MLDSVKVSHLNKSYTTQNSTEIVVNHNRSAASTRTVLRDLSISFPIGKLSVIVGRSGCGKSTLLRILNGDEAADSGAVEMPEGWHTSMLSPTPYVITWTSLKRNVEMAAGAGRSPEERSLLADRLLNAVSLGEFADMTPQELSTGMRQRLGLARVLASRSEVLLMDEPFAALDFLTREELQHELLALQHEMQRTIILVTHQLDEALILGDSVTVMHSDSTYRTFDLSDYPFPRDPDSPPLRALGLEIREECKK